MIGELREGTGEALTRAPIAERLGRGGLPDGAREGVRPASVHRLPSGKPARRGSVAGGTGMPVGRNLHIF